MCVCSDLHNHPEGPGSFLASDAALPGPSSPPGTAEETRGSHALFLKQKQTRPGRALSTLEDCSPHPSTFVEVTERCLRGSHGARTLGPPRGRTCRTAAMGPPWGAGPEGPRAPGWGQSRLEDPGETFSERQERFSLARPPPSGPLSPHQTSMVAPGPPSVPLCPSVPTACLPANLLYLSFWHLLSTSPKPMHSPRKNCLLAHLGKNGFARWTS